MMGEEIVLVLSKPLLHQKPPAHFRKINAKWNVNSLLPAITHQNSMAAMALADNSAIINAAYTVDMGVIDIEDNDLWERLQVSAVSLVRYMGKCIEGLQSMRHALHLVNKDVVMPVKVRWLENSHSTWENQWRGRSLHHQLSSW
jgi:hypothetical protein